MKVLKNKSQNIKLRIKLFNSIRDIPYLIGQKEVDASCYAKTKILGDLLIRTGLNCQVFYCQFLWKNLRIPKKLLDLTKKPYSRHYFLKVYIPERKKWVYVDPTWDKGLRTKFKISEWDGLSNTILAVSPLGKINKFSKTLFCFPFRDFNQKDLFTSMLNKWLLKIRRK